MPIRWLAASLVVGLLCASLPAQTLPAAQQITSSTDGISEGWNNRTSPTSGGKILFAGSDDTIYLYDGSTIQSVQTTTGQAIEKAVLMLGTGSTPGSVIGGWRRGAGSGWVSVDGGTPHEVTLNPEHLSIRDGCVFMALQTAADGNQAFKIDPATGNRTQVSSDTVSVNHGAFRVVNDGCSKLAYGWLNDGNLSDLQYWNGTSATTLASTIVDSAQFAFAGGKIVYTKTVSGIQQVFLIDTAVSLTSVQLSSETDATKVLSRPQTDGRHVAWFRSDADGSNAQLVLNGGIVFPTGTLGVLGNEFPYQLNRGQLLWTNSPTSPRTIYYDDGMQTSSVDPSSATDVLLPWLTDGTIVFVGPTATSGGDNEVFRITATAPTDASQPAAPLIVTATPATGQVTVDWDRVLGATSYNLYMATVPGVTKENYASLPGGQKITVSNPPSTLTLPSNNSYSFTVTTVDATGEGPNSRVASAMLVGNLTWQSVGGLSSTSFFSVAADPSSPFLAYAGGPGTVYRSTNGGINWTLSSLTTGATRIAALAVAGSTIFANAMAQATLWKSVNSGVDWNEITPAGTTGFGEPNGSLAIDPSDSDTIYAGDFILTSKTATDSLVIKTVNGGMNWNLTPEGPGFDEIHAYAMAIDPNDPLTLYAGGSGTPNIVQSSDGAASWTDIPIPGATGGVYSIAVDPNDSRIVYATTRDLGVFKSSDGGTTWTAKNNGLSGAGTIGTGFNSIVIDPRNSNYLHLGTGLGYWYSIDGGDNWNAANGGFGGTPPYIDALALTPAHRLIAATDSGLWMLGVGPAPVVTAVVPAIDNTAGGTMVTITGTGFQPSPTVTFGGTAATNVTLVDDTTITATTPAHAAGAVDLVVTNFDGRSGTLAGGFTYTATPVPPANLAAAGQSATSIHVTWSAAPTATSYQVLRRDAGGGFAQIATPAGTSYDDTVPAGSAHVYRVRAVNGSGASGDSNQDLATAILFTNDPLTAGTTIKAVHLTELRTAVNSVRTLAGLGSAAYTYGTITAGSSIIHALDMTQLRTNLGTAISGLGLTTPPYTNPTITAGNSIVKAVDFTEIRNAVR